MESCRNVILMILILGISGYVFGQDDLQKKVLLKNKVGNVYTFNRSTKKDGLNKITVKYLGVIKARDSVFKVVTRSTVWGKNKHTTGAIYIYTGKNDYYGKFQLGDAYMLPERIDKNELVFHNKNRPICSPGVVTKVSFKNGLPREIFIKCSNTMGDLYLFEKN